MKEICEQEIGLPWNFDIGNSEKDCEFILSKLEKKYDAENLTNSIPTIIGYNEILYDPEIDEICLIVDRDQNSFTQDQYQYVMKECEVKKYRFFVTNPFFEFWLLLHFDEVLEMDRSKLIKNPKTIINKLSKLLKGYQKSKYDVHNLVDKVDMAIKNESYFCEDIRELEYQIGSNIGILLKELKTDN